MATVSRKAQFKIDHDDDAESDEDNLVENQWTTHTNCKLGQSACSGIGSGFLDTAPEWF